MEKQTRAEAVINNDFYDLLKDDWYTAADHPIALLRAENAVRAPWVAKVIEGHYSGKAVEILDVGCGGGFLSNHLAAAGHACKGIDLSDTSLETAKKHDKSGKAVYLKANAYTLPFENSTFDAVCAMDILEHVDSPKTLIGEAGRVLKPGGLFFFHTFNRNFMSNLLIIKGVDWFVRNAPKNMHVYPLLIKPQELCSMMETERLKAVKMHGFIPDFLTTAFWRMVFTGRIPANFRFKFTKSLATGYCGYAVKV